MAKKSFGLMNDYDFEDIGTKETHLKELAEKKNYLVDYNELEINDNNDLELLKSYEEESLLYYKQATKSIYEVSRILYNARNLLAKYGSGKFKSWFTSIGFKKDFVYNSISRYELLLQYKEIKVEERKMIDVNEIHEEEQEVMNLPIKTINKIKKLDLTKDEIKEVVNSFDYEKTISELKVKKEENKIIEPEIVEDIKTSQTIKEEIKKKKAELNKIHLRKDYVLSQIEKLEKEYDQLEIDGKNLSDEISSLEKELIENFQ